MGCGTLQPKERFYATCQPASRAYAMSGDAKLLPMIETFYQELHH